MPAPFACVALENPLGSGALIVVEHVGCHTFDSTNRVSIYVSDSSVGLVDTSAGSHRDFRQISGVVSATGMVGRIMSGFVNNIPFITQVAVIWELYASPTEDRIVPLNVVLPPGFSLGLFEGIVGNPNEIWGNFRWYERVMEPEETR